MDSDFSSASKKAEIKNTSKKTYLTTIEQSEKFFKDWHVQEKNRLIYIESGTLYLESDSITSLVPARHAIWIPENQKTKLETNLTDVKLCILIFDERLVEDNVNENIKVFPVRSLGRELILKLSEWNKVSETMTELETASLHVIQLLIPQWAQAPAPILLPISNHPKLSPALRYVRENIQTHIMLGDVAKICSMSKRTLTRLFQQELGISFSTYIRLTRVTLALEMFNESRASVSQVAFDVGYESITAFSNTFQLFVGIRPQEYLKNISKSQ